MNEREKIVAELARLIQEVDLSHPVRVGIDGVDCSGKTTLSDELAEVLRGTTREIIRVSIDGFHNHKNIRYRQGSLSAKGFYEDTFNNEAIISQVLSPLGPVGDLRYNSSLFDFRTDSPSIGEWKKAARNSILLFDGVFLQRPALIEHWDFVVFVHVNFDETVRRAKVRDQYLFGSADDVEARYLRRYIPGQEIYLCSVHPDSVANVIFDNNDPHNPILRLNKPGSY